MNAVARLAACAVVAVCAAEARSQDAPPSPPPPSSPASPTPPSDAPAWRTEDTTVRIPLRDGAALAADVYLPAQPGRYPVVVVQTPYDRRLMRAGFGAAQGGFGAGLRNAVRGDDRSPFGAWTDRAAYAYVVVDWRGRFGSRDAARGALPTLGRDGHDVVEWAAAQPWSDGKVGTWGPSALAVVQFATAAERPPHLVCAVPLVAAPGHRYEDFYADGVLREAHVAALDRLGFGTGALVRGKRDPAAPLYTFARRMEGTDRIDVPMLFVAGWFDHATDRMLLAFDEVLASSGPRAKEGSRLLVGPWHHTAVDAAEQGDLRFPGAEGEAARETRAFFDRHLRGQGVATWDARPRVRTFRAFEETTTGAAAAPGGGTWTGAGRFPREGTGTRTFLATADGALVPVPATASAPATPSPSPSTTPVTPAPPRARTVLDDPRRPVPTVGGANLPAPGLLPGPRDQASLLGRADVLRYETAPLTEPLRIEGAATFTVHVRVDPPTPSGPTTAPGDAAGPSAAEATPPFPRLTDADVAVRLCRIAAPPGGDAVVLLADGIARASFDGRRHVPLAPGEPRRVTVTLPPLAATFAAGDRLVLLVSCTNHPRFERNGHTGSPGFDPATAVPARVTFLHDDARAATLVLPLLR